MKNKLSLVSTSLLLGTIMATPANAEKSGFKEVGKPITAPISLNAHHAHYQKRSDKSGFNPQRSVSPKQYQQLLATNRTLVDHYKIDAKPLIQQNASLFNVNASSNCTSPSELQNLSGEALVAAVKAGSLTSCLYGLFDNSLVGTSVFSDASILTIASAINAHLQSYDANNMENTAELEKLVIYLRAMHWAESSNNRVFSADYNSAVSQALTTYISGAHFTQFNGEASRDFMVRYEMLVLLRSSGNNSVPHLARLTEALLGYADSINRDNNWGVYYEENGATQLLIHLYNASEYQTSELEQEATNNPAIINNLKQFVNISGQWLIGHTREYQWADSVKELARFLRYGGTLAESVRPSIQAILQQYSYDGTGSSGWLNAQSMVKFYDAENCSIYGDACNFNLEEIILSGRHTCGTTLKIRYQEPIIEDNLAQICTNLAQQEQKFHDLFRTNANTPVANDLNTDLEVVIFSSYTDYDQFAGDFFGINTNNGGMYLEGDPWVEGNQARFIAHQATWLPDFAVWNLEHEYVHYLDGRFNKWGSFGDQPSNSVWWGEGLAEYLSQPYNNANALAVAPQNTYTLSQLFETTYENSNTERTYHWGYLATRFMIEQQHTEVENVLLPSMRAAKRVISTTPCEFDWGWKLKTEAVENGWAWAYDDSEWASGSWVWTCGQPQEDVVELPAYTPYQDILATWGTSFDADFSAWLACIVEGEGICQAQSNPADFDDNNTIDQRDINLFRELLRNGESLSLIFDFNNDGAVDRRDVRPMMALCDLPRCAIAQ